MASWGPDVDGGSNEAGAGLPTSVDSTPDGRKNGIPPLSDALEPHVTTGVTTIVSEARRLLRGRQTRDR